MTQVKEKTSETVGIHTELYQLMRDKWRSLMGRCSKNYISDAKLGLLLKQWAGEDEKEAQAKVGGRRTLKARMCCVACVERGGGWGASEGGGGVAPPQGAHHTPPLSAVSHSWFPPPLNHPPSPPHTRSARRWRCRSC